MNNVVCNHRLSILLCFYGGVYFRGGISIKPSAGMDEMRADMGGAACVVSSIQAAASLAIPINVKGTVT